MNFRGYCVLGLGVAILAGCNRQAPVQAKQDSGPVRVRTAQVVTRDLKRDVESVGSLFPYEEVVISSEIEGPVEAVNADLGDRVTQNQVLVRVSDEEQRYLLAQNEAQLRQALERLGLKDEKDRVRDIKETPDVRRAQADLFDAEQRYKRVRNLVEQQIGSRQDLDQAQARYQSAQAAYDTTLNQTRNLIQDVERSKAIVDLQRKKLRDTSIRAPFTADVKERQVNVGQYVRVNTPVFTLVKTDPIRLRIEVPERMAPWIKVGQMADVSLEAFPDRMFRGKIWRISPTVEQTKRTFIVEALIDNPIGELKPGSYAKAQHPHRQSGPHPPGAAPRGQLRLRLQQDLRRQGRRDRGARGQAGGPVRRGCRNHGRRCGRRAGRHYATGAARYRQQGGSVGRSRSGRQAPAAMKRLPAALLLFACSLRRRYQGAGDGGGAENRQAGDGSGGQDFTLTDDRTPRAVEAAEFVQDTLDIMLLLDTSLVGGMVQPVAEDLIAQLQPKEQMAVVSFHSSADLIQDFTSSRQLMLRAISQVKYGNTPRVLDALYAAIDGGFQDTTFRRVILLLTAGMEGPSRTSEREVIRLARRNGVSIYPVYMSGGERSLFENLARQTGGASFNLRDLKRAGMPRPGARVFEVARGHYVLTRQREPCVGRKAQSGGQAAGEGLRLRPAA